MQGVAAIGSIKGNGSSLNSAAQNGGLKNFFGELKLKENMMQLKHEAFLSWAPKLIFLGALRGIGGTLSQNGQKASPVECLTTTIKTILDELAVEVQEAFACYFVPSLFGSFFSKMASQAVGLKDYMLAGEPYKKILSRKVGQFVTVGKPGRQRQHLLTEETFRKTVRVKFFAALMTTALGAFLEGIAPTVQNIFSLKALNTGSFLELSGVPLPRTEEQKEEQNKFIWERSIRFVKKMALIFGSAMAVISGLSILGGKRSGFMNTKAMGKVLNYLDFSNSFELSRAMFAGVFGIGIWSYLAGSRPEIVYRDGKKVTINPEFWESLFRASMWVIPGALLMKDQMTNFLSWRFVGKPNNLPVLTPMSEVLKGPFFDFKRVKFDRIKNLPEFKAFGPDKQASILRQLERIEKSHVFWAVFGVSMVINTLNFLRTLWMSHSAQNKAVPAEGLGGLEFQSLTSRMAMAN